jgi:sulfatase modifying factor 1
MTRRFVAVTFVAATMLIPSAWLFAQEPKQGKKLALVIGVERYDGTGLRNLDFAEKDATDLAEVLTQRGYKVTLMTRSEFKRTDKDFLQPAAENIRDQLINGVLKGRDSGDTVLLAFSGHGAHLKATDKLYFCASGTRLDRPETMVSIDEVMAALKNCRAGSKMLLMDACRNDPNDDKSDSAPPELKSVTRPLIPDPPGGTVALFGCSRGQRSFESREFKHGFMMHYVIEGLKGTAANPKTGLIFWDDLVAHVKREVPDAVKEQKGPKIDQFPESLGQASRIELGLVSASNAGSEVEEPYDWKGEKRTRRVLKLDLGGGEKLELVRIKGGTFAMGSADSELKLEGEAQAFDDEAPRHSVTLSDFYISKYPVTKGQFARFVAEEGYKTEAERDGAGGWGHDSETGKFAGPMFDWKTGNRNGGENTTYSWRRTGFKYEDDHPVVNVTYADAEAYCRWAAKKTGRRVQLPTEARYEYANRGGTTTRYFTGDDPSSLEGYANVADRSARAKFPNWKTFDFDDGHVFTSPVGSFKANPFGLHDMTGNVWSWCIDRYGKYSSAAQTDPEGPGPDAGSARVVRGGSWGSSQRDCRAARRGGGAPPNRGSNLGFRVSLVPSGQDK